MTKFIIIPGLGNSGPEHWQSYFEKSSQDFIRINQHDWDSPKCEDWVETINNFLSKYDLSDVILIGHSLGCATIAHWAAKYNKTIKGAMHVAPSDVEAPKYTESFPTSGFAPMPLIKLNFKTIVVASGNDEWVSLERAKFFAENWGSEFINIGNAGHINVSAGYGKWDRGFEILKTFG